MVTKIQLQFDGCLSQIAFKGREGEGRRKQSYLEQLDHIPVLPVAAAALPVHKHFDHSHRKPAVVQPVPGNLLLQPVNT